MPYANDKCGIYIIGTPNGSCYVGSSTRIRGRWSEHRYALRGGKHHSIRLQKAFAKHGAALKFEIIEECAEDQLNEREQFHIKRLGAKLNTSQFVKNVWLDPEVREKFRKVHSSDKWRDERRAIIYSAKARWVGVTCSDGRSFENMAEAGRAFGVRTSHIKLLAETQWQGKLGVRFRRTTDEWRPPQTWSEKILTARVRNGTRHHSEETKKRMKRAAVGRRPCAEALRKSHEANKRPVISINIKTGEPFKFSSMREAAKAVHPANVTTAGTQICKVCSGVKKTAYGYYWQYAPLAEVA